MRVTWSSKRRSSGVWCPVFRRLELVQTKIFNEWKCRECGSRIRHETLMTLMVEQLEVTHLKHLETEDGSWGPLGRPTVQRSGGALHPDTDRLDVGEPTKDPERRHLRRSACNRLDGRPGFSSNLDRAVESSDALP